MSVLPPGGMKGGVAVLVGVAVGVAVWVGVFVAVGVLVAVGVFVLVAVAVGPAIITVNVWPPVLPAVSATPIVKVKVPPAVGVLLNKPLLLSVRPGGSSPLTSV